MKKSVYRMAGTSIIVASACSQVSLSVAQEDSGLFTLEEISVTATKRSESISDVPMSITAMSGDNLQKLGVTDTSDLMAVIPGLTFTKTHDSVPVYSIRGVGFYDNSLGATPAVSVYIDEVTLPYPVMSASATLDLERVEVLKGPQGTLFGQNATGGAINFVAAKPQDTFAARLSAGYGSYNTFETTGFVTGPLGDTVNARLAARYESADGWQESYTRDDKLGEVDRGAARGIVDWLPSDDLSLSFVVESWYDKSESQAAKLAGVFPTVPGFQNPELASGDPFGITGPPSPLVQTYPVPPSDNDKADWSPDNNYESDTKYQRLSARIEYDINDDMTLTSITAAQDMDYITHIDVDGTSLDIQYLNTNADIETFYQELRLSGDSGDLSWMVGANYSDDSVKSINLPVFTEWSAGLDEFTISTKNKSKTKAVFFNLEYQLNDAIRLQGSARYTDVTQDMKGCPRDNGDGFTAYVFNNFVFPDQGLSTDMQPGDCYSRNDIDGSFDFVEADLTLEEDNTSWRISLDYTPNDDTLMYANISQGYKAGAFTLAVFNFLSEASPATQESILAYETGFKHTKDSYQLSGALFYYDYEDKQLLAPFETETFGLLDKLQNIPESEILGAEFEAVWLPLGNLRLSLSGTYIDSEVTSDFLVDDGNDTQINLKGAEFTYTPDTELVADAEYGFDLGSDWRAVLGVSVSYRSDTVARFSSASDLYDIDGYTLVNLRAGAETNDGRYAVDLWMRNVGDEDYTLNTVQFLDTIISYEGQPTTYGIRGTVNF